MLDTNIAIDLVDGDEETLNRLAGLEGAVLISMITRVELEGGVHRDPEFAETRGARLDRALQSLPRVDFDDKCAEQYRAILSRAGFSRRKVLDRMIAAQALVHRAVLVTRNASDFADIPALEILSW